jgi:hypothetical protein
MDDLKRLMKLNSEGGPKIQVSVAAIVSTDGAVPATCLKVKIWFRGKLAPFLRICSIFNRTLDFGREIQEQESVLAERHSTLPAVRQAILKLIGRSDYHLAENGL